MEHVAKQMRWAMSLLRRLEKGKKDDLGCALHYTTYGQRNFLLTDRTVELLIKNHSGQNRRPDRRKKCFLGIRMLYKIARSARFLWRDIFGQRFGLVSILHDE